MPKVVENRGSAKSAAKSAARRDDLAAAAIKTLSELGFARASLREIAQSTIFSYSVVHYYFRDKIELIAYCVRQYKTQCITRYDVIVATSSTADELRTRFASAMAETLRDDGNVHRLWYDMRSQAMFEPRLREDVVDLDRGLEQMIWRVVSRYAELADKQLAVTPPLAYALFDGIFQRSLLERRIGPDANVGADLERDAAAALDLVI